MSDLHLDRACAPHAFGLCSCFCREQWIMGQISRIQSGSEGWECHDVMLYALQTRSSYVQTAGSARLARARGLMSWCVEIVMRLLCDLHISAQDVDFSTSSVNPTLYQCCDGTEGLETRNTRSSSYRTKLNCVCADKRVVMYPAGTLHVLPLSCWMDIFPLTSWQCHFQVTLWSNAVTSCLFFFFLILRPWCL